MSVRECVEFYRSVDEGTAGAGDQNSGDWDLVIAVDGEDCDCDSLTTTACHFYIDNNCLSLLYIYFLHLR